MSIFVVHFFQNKSRRSRILVGLKESKEGLKKKTSQHLPTRPGRIHELRACRWLQGFASRRKKKFNGTGGLPQCSGWNASDSIVCGTGSLLLNLTKMLLQMQKHFYSLTAGALFCSQTSNFNVSWVNANGAWMELASTRLCLERSLVGSLSYFPSCLPSCTPP